MFGVEFLPSAIGDDPIVHIRVFDIRPIVLPLTVRQKRQTYGDADVQMLIEVQATKCACYAANACLHCVSFLWWQLCRAYGN